MASNDSNHSDNTLNMKENTKMNSYEEQGTIILPNEIRINSSVSTETSSVNVRMDSNKYTGIEFVPMGTIINSDKEMQISEISPQRDDNKSNLNSNLKFSPPKGLVGVPVPSPVGLSIIFPDNHAQTEGEWSD